MNIMKMMQQAKAMQEKMQVMDAEFANVMVEGVAGGGLVKTVMSCKGYCRSVTLDPTLLKEDKEIIEDMIMAAVNDAKAKGDQRVAEDTQKMMSDLGLPAGAKLPF